MLFFVFNELWSVWNTYVRVPIFFVMIWARRWDTWQRNGQVCGAQSFEDLYAHYNHTHVLYWMRSLSYNCYYIVFKKLCEVCANTYCEVFNTFLVSIWTRMFESRYEPCRCTVHGAQSIEDLYSGLHKSTCALYSYSCFVLNVPVFVKLLLFCI